MNPRLGILLLISDPVAIVLTLTLLPPLSLSLPFTSFAFEFAFCALFMISLANTSVPAAGCDLCCVFFSFTQCWFNELNMSNVLSPFQGQTKCSH